MEIKDDSQWEYEPAAEPEPESEPASEPQYTVDEEPYRGAGAGRKESPFADSPYEMNRPDAPRFEEPPVAPPTPPVAPASEEKPKKRVSGLWKRVLAGALVVVLVAASCGITAACVNSRWEKETQQMTKQFNQQIAELQGKIEANSNVSSGTSISGSPVSTDGGLTPSQVYAQNKMSVVAITNIGYTTSYGRTYETSSSGSGFILTEDGYVVTNYHVVENASVLTVTTYDGTEYEATLKGYDSTNDLAVLKVEAEGLPAVTIGSSDNLVIGDMVVAIGNPLGELTSTQTVGYISGKDRDVSTDGTILNMLQTDAAINPGNSGGPLFNMKGEVVGITTAKYSGTTSSGASIEGIGFAIPIDDVVGMISDIIEYGYVTGAYLGVAVVDVSDEAVTSYGLPKGCLVDSVTDGGSAARAGVRSQDIIIALGDYTVTGYSDLRKALRKFKAGDETTITVYRSGRTLELAITLDEKPNTNAATTPEETVPMPSGGSYEEWYRYFFGDGSGN